MRLGLGRGTQARRQALCLERTEQTAGAFVAEHVGDQLGRLAAGQGAQVRQRKGERHAAQILDRLHAQHAQRRLGRQIVARIGQIGALVVGHRREQRARPGLELLQAHRPGQRQRHAVGAVVAAVKGQQFLARGAGQRLGAADAETARRMTLTVSVVAQRVLAPVIVLEVLLKLGVDRVDFTRVELGRELRRDEELRKAVERALESVRPDLQVVVRAVERGVGVVAAAVALEVLAEVFHRRVLFRAEEQHVLEVMRQPRALRRISQAAHAHRHRGRRHVELGVGQQQHLHAVGQHEAAQRRLIIGCRHARRYGSRVDARSAQRRHHGQRQQQHGRDARYELGHGPDPAAKAAQYRSALRALQERRISFGACSGSSRVGMPVF